MFQLDLLNRDCFVSQEEIGRVKYKLTYCKEQINLDDNNVLKHLLETDRDFIIAPEYFFSVKEAIKQKECFSINEVSRFMNTNMSDIWKMELSALKHVRERVGCVDLFISKPKGEKKMSLRGEKPFKNEFEAMRYLVQQKKTMDFPDKVDLTKGELGYRASNLRRAGEVVKRVDGDILDLSDMPVLKRGRPSHKKEIKLEVGETLVAPEVVYDTINSCVKEEENK